MAVDSKFFNIPFATSGDKATIPEAVQPSGAISFTQGFGPDYERDPATDPLAKRVPRDETNELYYEITLALKYLQLYGTPQYTAVADGGPANYPLSARVRYDAGAGMQAWRSLIATNTAVPGSDATKWALEEAFSEATLVEALAGTIGGKAITPRLLASSVQRGVWVYAVAGGTASAMTATLVPALAAYVAGLAVRLVTTAAPTGATTLNVNGLGAIPVLKRGGIAIIPNEWIAGDVIELVYDGTNFRMVSSQRAGLDAAGFTQFTTTPVTLTPANALGFLNFTGGASVVNLPLSASYPAGQIIPILNTTSGGTLTINTQGSDDITLGTDGAGSGRTQFKMTNVEVCLLMSGGPANNWVVYDGSTMERYQPSFASTLSTFGLKRIPDANSPTGYISVQWGTATIATANTYQTVTLPAAYPNQVMSVQGCSQGPTGGGGATFLNGSQIRVWAVNAGQAVSWMTIGY